MTLHGHTAFCPARSAIAGNPSDGHGGAVVSTVVPAIGATVTVRPSERFEVAGTALSAGSLDELVERVAREGCGDVQPLVPAVLVALHRHLDARVEPHHIDVRSTIPRSVGLAGSSAIVIATIRALIAADPDASWATSLADDPALLASVALAVERDVLGIAAGLQDRVVQAFGGTVAMDFGPRHVRTVRGLEVGTYRTVGPLPPGMFVVYRAGAATDSGSVHGAVDPESAGVRDAMSRAADAGRQAAAAIESGDVSELAAAMNATFDQRALAMALDPAHVEMVTVARAHGAAANYTGSGGAIIVLPLDGAEATVRAALAALPGCAIVALT